MHTPPMNLVSPQGTVITGTLETISGRSGIIPGSARQNPHGGFAFDHDGETEIVWEDQRAVTRDGERIFLDKNWREFRESELRLVPAENRHGEDQ